MKMFSSLLYSLCSVLSLIFAVTVTSQATTMLTDNTSRKTWVSGGISVSSAITGDTGFVPYIIMAVVALLIASFIIYRKKKNSGNK